MSRTYTQDQVEEILRRAARSTAESQARAAKDSGLSLQDLMQIGAESGLDVDEVVRAAHAVDHGVPETFEKRLLGMNISASHSVRLPGRLSDEEFSALVSDCRRTFLAKGDVVVTGELREWSNGNLHVTAEPEGKDTYIRFRTHRGVAASFLGAAGTAAFMSIMLSTNLWSGGVVDPIVYVMMGVLGSTAMVLAMMGTLGTKSWAKQRKSQMQSLASRALARRAETAPGEFEPATASLPAQEPRIEFDESLETDVESDLSGVRRRER